MELWYILLRGVNINHIVCVCVCVALKFCYSVYRSLNISLQNYVHIACNYSIKDNDLSPSPALIYVEVFKDGVVAGVPSSSRTGAALAQTQKPEGDLVEERKELMGDLEP